MKVNIKGMQASEILKPEAGKYLLHSHSKVSLNRTQIY